MKHTQKLQGLANPLAQLSLPTKPQLAKPTDPMASPSIYASQEVILQRPKAQSGGPSKIEQVRVVGNDPAISYCYFLSLSLYPYIDRGPKQQLKLCN